MNNKRSAEDMNRDRSSSSLKEPTAKKSSTTINETKMMVRNDDAVDEGRPSSLSPRPDHGTTTFHKVMNCVFQQKVLHWKDALSFGSICQHGQEIWQEHQEWYLLPLLDVLEGFARL